MKNRFNSGIVILKIRNLSHDYTGMIPLNWSNYKKENTYTKLPSLLQDSAGLPIEDSLSVSFSLCDTLTRCSYCPVSLSLSNVTEPLWSHVAGAAAWCRLPRLRCCPGQPSGGSPGSWGEHRQALWLAGHCPASHKHTAHMSSENSS